MKSLLVLVSTLLLGSCQPVYASDILKILKAEEGFKPRPYLGPLGYIHIGYGYKLHTELGQDPEDFLLRINEDIATSLLEIQIQKTVESLEMGQYADTFNKQSIPVQDVLVSMAYQLGHSGLYEFTRMWSALDVGNMEVAAQQALDSVWALQTPNRARRHAEVIRTGKPHEYLDR